MPAWVMSFFAEVVAWFGAIASGQSAATLPPPTPPPAWVISASPIAIALPSATPVAVSITPRPDEEGPDHHEPDGDGPTASPVRRIADPRQVTPPVLPSANPTPAPGSSSLPASSPSVTPDAPLPLQGTPWPKFPSSAFNVPITNPVVVPNSSSMLARVVSGGLMPFRATLAGTSQYNTVWSHPIYFAKPSDPVYTIHCTMYGGACPASGATVHIPRYAVPENTSDAHLGVVDGPEYDFWASSTPSGSGGTLNIGWGGFGPVNGNGYGMAGTAGGFAQSMGLVRPEELIARVIPHALLLVVPCENGHIPPATGDDNQPQAGCPPLGSHVQLQTSDAAIEASGASQTTKTIEHALHQYGGYIGEKCTSCSMNLVAVDAQTFTAPGFQNLWDYVSGASGSSPAYFDMSSIDSSQLAIIQ